MCVCELNVISVNLCWSCVSVHPRPKTNILLSYELQISLVALPNTVVRGNNMHSQPKVDHCLPSILYRRHSHIHYDVYSVRNVYNRIDIIWIGNLIMPCDFFPSIICFRIFVFSFLLRLLHLPHHHHLPQFWSLCRASRNSFGVISSVISISHWISVDCSNAQPSRLLRLCLYIYYLYLSFRFCFMRGMWFDF